MRQIKSAHLTEGQRQFLARKGIRGRDWDKLSPDVQKQWLVEMKEGTYDKNDREQKTTNNNFKF